MPRWNKKVEEGVEAATEVEVEETPLEQPKEAQQEAQSVEGEPTEAQREYEERVNEIIYEMRKGLNWASDLTGVIHRALEDRTPLMVTERDLEALEFYQLVLTYAAPDAIAHALQEAERVERTKRDSDVSIS